MMGMKSNTDFSEEGRRRAAASEELLLNFARQHSNIESILDFFFDFLQRRTDFFHLLEPETSGNGVHCSTQELQKQQQQQTTTNMGFADGRAEAMVRSAFLKAQRNYRRRAQPHLLGIQRSEGSSPKKQQTSLQKQVQQRQQQQCEKRELLQNEFDVPVGLGNVNAHVDNLHSSSVTSNYTSATDSDGRNSKNGSNEGSGNRSSNQTTVEENRQRMSEITTWNGGVCEKYRWTQTLRDLTLQMKLDRTHYQTKKDLDVIIVPTQLHVTLKGKTLLKGEFEEPVDAAESLWQVEDSQYLLLSLEKTRENWWSAVFKGEEPIDTTKIESVKRVEDFDAPTQAHIRKMLYDQQQKLKGEKTSEEILKEQLLKKAWDAEGSPFKGMPFDPSLLKLSGQDIPAKWRDDLK